MGSHAKRGAESTKSLQNKNTEIYSVFWCSRRDLLHIYDAITPVWQKMGVHLLSQAILLNQVKCLRYPPVQV
ncbi:MAG: hypothetical protein IKD35_00130, partial [Clostridia bacterium]|nr:hypothetical protein [Clostridia bacterium]